MLQKSASPKLDVEGIRHSDTRDLRLMPAENVLEILLGRSHLCFLGQCRRTTLNERRVLMPLVWCLPDRTLGGVTAPVAQGMSTMLWYLLPGSVIHRGTGGKDNFVRQED